MSACKQTTAMTKFKPYALLLLPVLLFSSCLKDKCTQTYTIFSPVYKTKQEVYAGIKSKPAQAIKNPGKITLFGSYIFLNEINKGIHVIDNSNPSAPKNLSFIEMPGNVDLAVKGSRLYADLYSDLITLDITNPQQVGLVKVSSNVFPYRTYSNGFVADTNRLIVDWNRKDTVVEINCSNNISFPWFVRTDAMLFSSTSSNANAAGTVGINGSMARFALKNDYLYTVSNSDLKVFGLQNPDAPQQLQTVSVGWGIETIYPFKGQLFIGSNTGMFIYSIQNPAVPVRTGSFTHALACDPVIADDTHAYVTLRSGTNCRATINQLDVIDINNLQSPFLIKSYALTNPHGLAKEGNLLFVCDGKDGLKIYDATTPSNLKLIKQFTGFEAYDVIAWNNNALVVTKTALLQFDYSNANNIQQRSSIAIQK